MQVTMCKVRQCLDLNLLCNVTFGKSEMSSGPSRSRFPWWVYLGGYAGTYFALGFAYPLIAGETLPKTLYRLSIEK
jgi:hypothetical protein